MRVVYATQKVFNAPFPRGNAPRGVGNEAFPPVHVTRKLGNDGAKEPHAGLVDANICAAGSRGKLPKKTSYRSVAMRRNG